ncbi:MAG: rRNA ((2251)-2-O)-methyltransferase RlmB [Candidatus Adlerbacteria bacterium]|nr:rRNA ((2251)-2-O)-methyltransferase RlmB [Candidatus Adlerbacteria bacterium]
MKHNKIFIYGKHAVSEALEHTPKAVTRIFKVPKIDDANLNHLIKESGVQVSPFTEGAARSDMKKDTAHQGVIAQLSLVDLVTPFDRFMEKLTIGPDTVLVLMAGVTDPHNVGAIIRTAAGFGAVAVLMPDSNQAPISGTVVKVSAGMAFRIGLVNIPPVDATISQLKKKGFKIYGLAGEGKAVITDEDFPGPTVIVVGNEAQGLSSEIRKTCDQVLSIPIHPQCESLNVAAATAVALYSWSTHHKPALSPRWR